MGGHDRRQQPPLVANRAATVVLQRWLPSGVGSARSLSGSWGCARPSQPAKESEDDASSIHFHRPSLSTRSRLSTPSDCTIPWTSQINFREMHTKVAPIRSGNKWKRSWVGPFRTRPFATSLWPADAPTETPPSRTRTPPAGVHPLGRDAVCSAVLDRRVPSRGSRRQPPASRGNAIPLGRCLLRSQVLPTRNTPRPQPCPVGRPLVGGRSGHGGGGGKGKRENIPRRCGPPRPPRLGAAAAGGRAAPAAAPPTGTGDWGGGQVARERGGRQRNGWEAGQTEAEGQGRGRVRKARAVDGCAGGHSTCGVRQKGELREAPVARSVATRLYSPRPGRLAQVRHHPPTTAADAAGRRGRQRSWAEGGGYGPARRTAAWPAHPKALGGRTSHPRSR